MQIAKDQNLNEYMRSPNEVMKLERLGSMHQSYISFMRVLVRRIMQEQWTIQVAKWQLDDQGLGHAIYAVEHADEHYQLVVFSHHLDDELRNDRVIADQWDVTMALCQGKIDANRLAKLRANVPLQEGGRYDSETIVLSRGNRSSRNFNACLARLSEGKQPDVDWFKSAGYLYRTTAVYGSGKFGMADWQKVANTSQLFNAPFAAEMLTCYLLRDFSVRQLEHIAQRLNPEKACALAPEIKEYIGIGNSTGLGMAPYLINHPQLISQWIETKERNLARITASAELKPEKIERFLRLLEKVLLYLQQTRVPDAEQTRKNKRTLADLDHLFCLLSSPNRTISMSQLIEWSRQHCAIDAQEMFNSILMEVYPEHCIDQCGYVDEEVNLDLQESVSCLLEQIREHYSWALDFDFHDDRATFFFWYKSEEKMEPRLGQRAFEKGADLELPLDIARKVSQLYSALSEVSSDMRLYQFFAMYPELQSIAARVQSMSKELYGEIQFNALDEDMRPMDLLRCKLSFFGVSKFDPKSKLWVRNTMFQGAPILEQIGQKFTDDWFCPTAPEVA